ncbi:alpha/beta fold hydrolase [Planifilum fulgidum]|uniref:alpha/beta fold hydrolase n=1 Tax=Planifilum fulgidum TaxID=201973 RepID=UPI000B87B74D|nr:alpha/beta hydrolase [Planifilum fulgidum]
MSNRKGKARPLSCCTARRWTIVCGTKPSRFCAHTVRYDLRGAGRSGDGEGPFAHHDDLCVLLEALGVDRAFLLGISVGGKIAIDYALRYPDTVRSLVLINPGVSGYRWSDQFLAQEGDLRRLSDQGLSDLAWERFLQTWVEGPFR